MGDGKCHTWSEGHCSIVSVIRAIANVEAIGVDVSFVVASGAAAFAYRSDAKRQGESIGSGALGGTEGIIVVVDLFERRYAVIVVAAEGVMTAVLHAESGNVGSHDAVVDMGFDMVSQVAHETAKLCAFSTDEGAVKDTFAQGQVDVFFHQSDEAACGVVA